MANKNRRKGQTRDTDEVHIVANGGNFRLEEAQSSRSSKNKQHVVVSIAPEISPVGNFIDFLKQHAVVGLIIGFVIGNQVQSLVKQLIQSFVDPLTKLLFGSELSSKSFMLHFRGHDAAFSWGAMVYALVIFLFVIIFMYVAIRFLKLDEFDKESKKEK
jgi:large-conductance mechanosensitive channel